MNLASGPNAILNNISLTPKNVYSVSWHAALQNLQLQWTDIIAFVS